MSNILVVDDEQSICWGLARLAYSLGHQVQTAASAEEGLRIAAATQPDLLMLDVRLPGMDGLTALEQFITRCAQTRVIVMTAFGDLSTAVRAVRGGAFEYLLKPFDLAEVRSAMQRALQSPISAAPPLDTSTGEMVGNSAAMQALFKRIALAADSDTSVLIYGESGVGKELAARAIHNHSARSGARFVAVNIAALNPSLAEAELFGHTEGAFTGANRARDGLLVQAHGGTLFLDEVADIPMPLQVTLLRALEQREVLPVGADSPVATSFRVIAATHQDLNRLVQSGKFRQDLYFRLCAFELRIPPLRERVDDVGALARHFASRVSNGQLTLADEALLELQRRRWPGNVRELRNAIEHASVLARSGVVLPEHLPPEQVSSAPAASGGPSADTLKHASNQRARELLNDPAAFGEVYEKFLREVEAPLLTGAMEQYDQECAPAARALGLHRTTLKRKLDQLGDAESAAE
ncbi:MAG: sigma-54-dependent Fis family transcriptional regulator [Planctomycetales bacterium]|nr:sigma-54-dependent Fis family transcriptional regulator [Planctomycetales bacterium]